MVLGFRDVFLRHVFKASAVRSDGGGFGHLTLWRGIRGIREVALW